MSRAILMSETFACLLFAFELTVSVALLPERLGSGDGDREHALDSSSSMMMFRAWLRNEVDGNKLDCAESAFLRTRAVRPCRLSMSVRRKSSRW